MNFFVKFNIDNNIANGCEVGCSAVPQGICTACTNDTATGCTAVTCDVNKFNTNNDAIDGCEGE